MCFWIYLYEPVIIECILVANNEKSNYNARYGKYKIR
jgi:hypothetical protein